jgi:SAM-dependent methyltransferase
MSPMERRGDYGYDAPYALLFFAALGVASLLAAIVSWWNQRGPLPALAFYGAFFLANAFSFLYTTRRGKFQVWDKILDQLHLGGDERVLDMGCGRGAVLIAVAGRLTTGRVTGIDLWSTHDQSGNSRDVTMRNASLEGVEDRIHNIRSNADRAKAVSEAWRVLQPGGRLAIADIRATARYARTLRELGAIEIARRRLGWRFWYGNPLAGTSLVTASKL